MLNRTLSSAALAAACALALTACGSSDGSSSSTTSSTSAAGSSSAAASDASTTTSPDAAATTSAAAAPAGSSKKYTEASLEALLKGAGLPAGFAVSKDVEVATQRTKATPDNMPAGVVVTPAQCRDLLQRWDTVVDNNVGVQALGRAYQAGSGAKIKVMQVADADAARSYVQLTEKLAAECPTMKVSHQGESSTGTFERGELTGDAADLDMTADNAGKMSYAYMAVGASGDVLVVGEASEEARVSVARTTMTKVLEAVKADQAKG